MKAVRAIIMFFLIPVIFVVFTLKSLGRTKKYRGTLEPDEWYEIFPDGLVDSRGRKSQFFTRKGSANKLMVYFCGGGVSWSEKSAARPMSIPRMMFSITSYYFPCVFNFMKTLFHGILSRKPENPFADWNMIFIPYVSGDFHLGNNEFKYKNGKKTLYHTGEKNTRIIMDECKKLFPDADTLLICGESAGAFGAAGNASLVAGYYPDAKVTVYSDASQLVVPLWRETAEKVWRVSDKMLEKIEESGDLYYNLVEYSFGELGSRAVFLRSNTLYDGVLTEFGSTLRGGPHKATPEAVKYFHESLIATEKRFLESGIPYFAHLSSHNKNKKTGLTQHTMCHTEKSYHCSDDVGISIAQWLADAIDGNYRDVGRDELII